MAEIQTVTMLPSQTGINRVTPLPQWVDGDLPLTIPAVSDGALGFIFDFNVTSESERGLALNPPLPYSNEPEGQYWTLKLHTTGRGLPPIALGSWNLRFLMQSTPDLWSEDNQPRNWEETFVPPATVKREGDLVYAIGNTISFGISTAPPEVQFQPDGTLAIVYDLDFPDDVTDEAGTLTRGGIETLIRNPLWNGRMAFWLWGNNVGTAGPTITAITFAGRQIAYNTGKDGYMAHLGRPLIDDKTGLPAFAPNLTEDGYHHGTWTEFPNWDPADPRADNPTWPPDTEGGLDDDVGQ